MSEEPRWQAAIGYALCGVELELPEPGHPDPEGLAAALAAAGWTSDRLREHARDRIAEELAWPQAIPAGLRAGCGAAQLHAALGEARRVLGLVTLETRPPSERTTLTADEQRLLREVPPHHGS